MQCGKETKSELLSKTYSPFKAMKYFSSEEEATEFL